MDDKNRIATIHNGQAQQELAQTQENQNKLKEQYVNAAAENKAARDEINSLWKALDPSVQDAIIEDQKAWVISKKNKCGDVKVKASMTPLTDADYQSVITTFKCDTEMTQDRIKKLNGN